MNVKPGIINSLKKSGRAFLTWWTTGLLYLVPKTLKQKIIHLPDWLTIEKNAQEFTLKYYQGNSGKLIEQRTFSQENELDKVAAVHWLAQIRQPDMETIVLIPKKDILIKPLDLPLASEGDLHEVLGFEMDRQTPFTVDKVYFDCRVTGRDLKQQKLYLELFVVLREKIDSLLEEVRSWRQYPGTLTIASDGELISGLNLLPDELRPAANKRMNPLTRNLAIAAFTLFLIALYAPLARQQQILEHLENEVNIIRGKAKTLQPLIKEKEGILSRTQFLAKKREKQPLVINILKELTNILPDNTWVNRMIIRDDEIQLHGESDNATAIIQLIENSDYFVNAQFRSPITQNNSTNKDKFHVSATIKDGGTS